MDIDEIMERFALMVGLSEEEAAKWKPFCQDALVRILAQCREEVDPAEQSEALCAAVSAFAYYRYTLCTGLEDDVDFTAGNVRIAKKQNRSDQAKALWEEERDQIAHLLRDESFYFGRVRGRRHETQ